MPFIVIYDANVLYPNSLRDLLIRVAQAGLVQAKWTDQILDEMFRNLTRNRPDLDPIKLDRTRELMNRAIRDVLITGYEPLIDVLDLPECRRPARSRRGNQRQCTADRHGEHEGLS